jgi:repressor of nif and glnA expression
MAGIERRYSKEEIARRGDEIYERIVRPHLKPADKDRFVAIDVDTGEYEITDTELEAIRRLHARLPDSQTWLVRVGSRYVYRFGGRTLRGRPQ